MTEENGIRESIEAAFAESESVDPPPQPVEEKEASPTELDTEPSAPKEPEEAPTEKTELSDKSVEVNKGEAQKPISYPSSWSADFKARVSKLPPAEQAYLADRERQRDDDYRRKTEEVAKARRAIGEIDSVIGPRAERLQSQGVSPTEAISRLFAAQDALDRDPISAVKTILQSYGLSPEHLTGQEAPHDPVYSGLNSQISELRGMLEGQQAQARAQYIKSLEQEVEEFRNEKDEQGNLLRTDMSQVEDDMAELIPILRKRNSSWTNREVLNEAYSRAVRFNPETFSTFQQREAARLEAKKIEEAKTKARAAQKAAVSVKGAPGGGVSRANSGDLRSMLEEAFSEHS